MFTESLTPSGDIDYLKIGQTITDRKKFTELLQRETEKAASLHGNSWLTNQRRRISGDRQQGFAVKIGLLEEKLNNLPFQKNCVFRDMVLTFDTKAALEAAVVAPEHFDVYEIFLDGYTSQGSRRLLKWFYSEEKGEQVSQQAFDPEKICCVLKAEKERLDEEQIRDIFRRSYGQPVPVVASNHPVNFKLGIIYEEKEGFRVAGLKYEFKDMKEDETSVRRLVPVFQEPERGHTYRF